ADFEAHLATTRAAAVIVGKKYPEIAIPQIVHRNPYWAFAKAAQLFFKAWRPEAGVSPKAFVAPDAVIDASAAIMPFAYVGPRARIGGDVVLYPGVYIGADVAIGAGSELRANVVIE